MDKWTGIDFHSVRLDGLSAEIYSNGTDPEEDKDIVNKLIEYSPISPLLYSIYTYNYYSTGQMEMLTSKFHPRMNKKIVEQNSLNDEQFLRDTEAESMGTNEMLEKSLLTTLDGKEEDNKIQQKLLMEFEHKFDELAEMEVQNNLTEKDYLDLEDFGDTLADADLFEKAEIVYTFVLNKREKAELLCKRSECNRKIGRFIQACRDLQLSIDLARIVPVSHSSYQHWLKIRFLESTKDNTL